MSGSVTADTERAASFEDVAARKEAAMFDRFTDRARRVLGEARSAAAKNGHSAVLPQHLMAGIVADASSTASAALREAGIEAEALSEELERHLVPAQQDAGSRFIGGQYPYSPMTRHCLELACKASKAKGNDYVGTEHLLLGVMDNHDLALVETVLGAIGSSRRAVVAAVDKLLAEMDAGAAPKEAVPSPPSQPATSASSTSTEPDAIIRMETRGIAGLAKTPLQTDHESAVEAITRAFDKAADKAAADARAAVKARFLEALGKATAHVQASP